MTGKYETQMLIEAVERKADLLVRSGEDTPDIRGHYQDVRRLTSLLQRYIQEDK